MERPYRETMAHPGVRQDVRDDLESRLANETIGSRMYDQLLGELREIDQYQQYNSFRDRSYLILPSDPSNEGLF
jgi:hypothetical protein